MRAPADGMDTAMVADGMKTAGLGHGGPGHTLFSAPSGKHTTPGKQRCGDGGGAERGSLLQRALATVAGNGGASAAAAAAAAESGGLLGVC